MNPTRRQIAASLGAMLLLQAGRSLALQPPAGKVILTLSGRISQPNREGRAEFDMNMLEQLPQLSFVTQTPWYSQPRKFTGPLLRDVLAAAGAQGNTLRAIALNDYKVTLPVEDTRRHDVLLARLLDDQPMTVREKGPLFIVYPFDAKSELRNTLYYSRSAWQLKSIEVL